MNPQVTIAPDPAEIPQEPKVIMLGGTKVGSIKRMNSGSGRCMATINLRGPGLPSCTDAYGFADTPEAAIADAFKRCYAEHTATLVALRILARQFGLPLYDVEPEPTEAEQEKLAERDELCEGVF